MFESKINPMFRSSFSETIFNQKYRHEGAWTWAELCRTLVEDVCRDRMPKDDKDQLVQYMTDMLFIPGGRYLYYAGRNRKFFNNCYLLSALEDTREDWANLAWKAESCLSTGGGIGVDYSVYRPSGSVLASTGGVASGPLSKMQMINEQGRGIMQGGSRRSAIYASLNHKHKDVYEFMMMKNWHSMPVKGTDKTIADLKQADFNFPAPMDMTNISVNYDTEWLLNYWKTGDVGNVFKMNVLQAISTGEPGFSFNFFDKEKETLRNAPCHPDTWVYTSLGYKQIRDIVDVPVHVWTGKQYAPTVFNKTRSNDRVVKVTMTGRRSIVCSADHEFITQDGIRVPAEYLEVGTNILVSPPLRVGGKHSAEAYALAFVYGDGSFHTRYPRAEAPLCGSKEAVLCRMIDSGIPCEVARDKRGILRVYYKNHDVFRSRDKNTFPDDVFSWNELSQLDFIAGLADADGYYDGSALQIASKSKAFLNGVRRLCDGLGFVGMINKGSTGGYEGSGNEAWVLRVRGKLSRINTSRFKMLDTTLPAVKVKSVEEAGKSDVYCCDVGVEEHSFCAEGIIISNCTEVTSSDDSDVCNLGSINVGRIDNLADFVDVIRLATQFLLCGTLVADLPYDKVYSVRERNRRLGLGLMGLHEWLIKRGYRYEVVPELHTWLCAYKGYSTATAAEFSKTLSISTPVAVRAIAPTGSIGILAGTTTGIEPLFAVAYKRRYLKGTRWHHQYVVDGVTQELIDLYGTDPDKIETAIDLAGDFERRIRFQADIQDYVDMGISSTINLPAWGSDFWTTEKITNFGSTLARYAHRLRGFTCYPDGARGGQPLTSVPYSEAVAKLGAEFETEVVDVCEVTGHGGVCNA